MTRVSGLVEVYAMNDSILRMYIFFVRELAVKDTKELIFTSII